MIIVSQIFLLHFIVLLFKFKKNNFSLKLLTLFVDVEAFSYFLGHSHNAFTNTQINFSEMQLYGTKRHYKVSL